MTFSFIHTADWQIGKQFGAMPGDTPALLRDQRLRTVAQIAALARERSVDAVVVAGDVFDTSAVSDETIRRTVNALAAFPGPWLLLPGNHDPALDESVWVRMAKLGLPANVRPLAAAEPVPLAGGAAIVLSAPLRRRHDLRDLTEDFDAIETPAGSVRIGLAHGAVTEMLPERSEAMNPIARNRAESARLDYLALGDWHGCLEVGARAWYSGTPEPDRFKANDPGNVLHVVVEAPGRPPIVEKVPIGHYRWHLIDGSIYQPEDLHALEAQFDALPQPLDRHLVKLGLAGSVDLATREALDGVLAAWSARLRHLEADTEGLVVAATDDDLDRIDKTGFVRAAIDRLRTIQADPAHADHKVAGLALQHLYAQYKRLAG